MVAAAFTQISLIFSLSLLWIPLPTSSQCTNEYEEDTGESGEDVWRSLSSSCFTPIQSTSYGTIKLGREMQMTFDFTWNNYTFDPRGEPHNDYEQFFRIGCSAFPDTSPGSPCTGNGCRGMNAHYPSFWVTPPLDTIHGSDFGPPRMYLSISSDISTGICAPDMELTAWGELEVGVKLHIDIWWNTTIVIVGIGHYSDYTRDAATFPEKSIKFLRTTGTSETLIGWDMPVWFMGDRNRDPLINRGDAIIENIQIISKYFEPTNDPTTSPSHQQPTGTEYVPPPSSNPSTSSIIEDPSSISSQNPTIADPNPSTCTTTDAPSSDPTISLTNTPAGDAGNIPKTTEFHGVSGHISFWELFILIAVMIFLFFIGAYILYWCFFRTPRVDQDFKWKSKRKSNSAKQTSLQNKARSDDSIPMVPPNSYCSDYSTAKRKLEKLNSLSQHASDDDIIYTCDTLQPENSYARPPSRQNKNCSLILQPEGSITAAPSDNVNVQLVSCNAWGSPDPNAKFNDNKNDHEDNYGLPADKTNIQGHERTASSVERMYDTMPKKPKFESPGREADDQQFFEQGSGRPTRT